jgi:phage protein D/phage baseplate assembly protein gpV
VTTDTINNDILVGSFTIKANGTAVDTTAHDFMFIEVEQNLYVPSMALIRLRNMDLESTYPTTFAIGTAITINMGQSTSTTAEVFNGEVVAQELDFSPTGIPTITIRAYDKRHRLMRGRKIKVFTQVKDSDNFSSVGGAAGVTVSATATTEVYDWIIQNNETDLEFLTRRALRIGMEVMMDGTTLKMRKPTLDTNAAIVTWGEDLLELKIRLNSSNQVNSVTVRGWDPKTKQAIVGTSSSATFKPTYGLAKDGAALSTSFGSANVMYNVYRPVSTQAEAGLVAKAIHDDINGRAVTIQGSCFGNSALKVGTTVQIKGVGTNYNGKYYLTSCTHRFDMEGYITSFESNGKNTNSIIELTNQLNERGSGGIMGPVIGIISSNKVDAGKEHLGQVKVKYPTLGDSIVSDWVNLTVPMSGNATGIFFMPEVNDEVLVTFENGDISRPYIIGSVWNGTDKTPLATSVYVGGDGKIKQRVIKTTSGHIMTFDDSQDAPGITILDKTGKNKFYIDSTANKISIESDGDMLLKAKTKMTIEAADLDITVTNKITQKGGQVALQSTSTDINIKSTTDLKLEGGTSFDAKGTTGAKVAGLTLELKGDTTAKLEGAAMTEIKGGLIKLN